MTASPRCTHGHTHTVTTHVDYIGALAAGRVVTIARTCSRTRCITAAVAWVRRATSQPIVVAAIDTVDVRDGAA